MGIANVIYKVLDTEAVRAAVGVVVAVVGLCQGVGWIDVDTAANVVGFVTLVASGEFARQQVFSVKSVEKAGLTE